LVTGEAIPITIALASVIYFEGKTSGRHFNPAVSTMVLAKGDMNLHSYLGYIVSQILGALLALYLKKNILV
jgi:aquaporin Z